MRANREFRAGAARRFSRRALLRLAFVVTVATAASGHAPYGQWNVYRKRNLLILTSRSDSPSFAVGRHVAEVLAEHLPESRARVSRARDNDRIASLISTKQMDVAVLSRHDAAMLFAGRPPFADYGPVPLRAIVTLGGYLLVCREDFPPLHAYLLAETLMQNATGSGPAPGSPDGGASSPAGAVPAHRGARAYFEGRPPPED